MNRKSPPFTTEHAKTIMSLIGSMTVAELFSKDAYDAVKALADHQGVDIRYVYVYHENGKKIDAIKLVRMVTGLGLKEAKDMVEKQNPTGYAGWFGPVCRVEDGGESILQALKANNSMLGNNIDFRPIE
jgi:hypothetical protein